MWHKYLSCFCEKVPFAIAMFVLMICGKGEVKKNLKKELFCRNSIEYQEGLLLPICKQLISVKSCRHRSRRRRMKTNDYGKQVGQISMTKNMEIYKFLEKISIVEDMSTDRYKLQNADSKFEVYLTS